MGKVWILFILFPINESTVNNVCNECCSFTSVVGTLTVIPDLTCVRKSSKTLNHPNLNTVHLRKSHFTVIPYISFYLVFGWLKTAKFEKLAKVID